MIERGAYRGHFPLNVLQQMLLTTEKVGMLELCIVSLRLHQTPLLDVDYLTETICSHTSTNKRQRYLSDHLPHTHTRYCGALCSINLQAAVYQISFCSSDKIPL